MKSYLPMIQLCSPVELKVFESGALLRLASESPRRRSSPLLAPPPRTKIFKMALPVCVNRS